MQARRRVCAPGWRPRQTVDRRASEHGQRASARACGASTRARLRRARARTCASSTGLHARKHDG
eukprot:2809055-Pleurochrysis_carterae.AAC.1